MSLKQFSANPAFISCTKIGGKKTMEKMAVKFTNYFSSAKYIDKTMPPPAYSDNSKLYMGEFPNVFFAK